MAIGRHQVIHDITVAEITGGNVDTARIYRVTKGAFFGDIATGGGAVMYLVGYNGTSWWPLGMDPVMRLWPGMGWFASGTAPTLVQAANVLDYWNFTDSGTIDRIDISAGLPDGWAGRTVSKVEVVWTTDGTNTTATTIQAFVGDYVDGTDLANGGGTGVWNTGASHTVTPTGTAQAITRTATTNSTGAGAFSAGADQLRVAVIRRSGSDANTDAWRVLGVRIEVS